MNIIEIKAVNKYYNSKRVLKDISFNVKKGEVVSIIGPSGSGKSTLLRCIKGLEKINSGNIKINIKNRKIEIGYIFQNYPLFEHLNIMENLILAPIKLLKINKDNAIKEARRLLKIIDLEDKAKEFPNKLSGGEKQRVAIARALAMNPKIILFDEPTSALDPIMTNEVLSIILELTKKKMTIIIVTHELKFAKEVSDKIIFLKNGEIIESGNLDKIFNNSENEEIKKFINI